MLPRQSLSQAGLVALGLLLGGGMGNLDAAEGGKRAVGAPAGLVWEGEQLEMPAGNDAARNEAVISWEARAVWQETIRLLTVLTDGEAGSHAMMIDALLEPTPDQRVLLGEQYRKALGMLPILQQASPTFTDARVVLLELRDVVAEYWQSEATVQTLRSRHRVVTERDTYGHNVGRWLNALLEGARLNGELGKDFRDRSNGVQELYRRQGLPAIMRLTSAEVSAGAFKTKIIDDRASPYYFLTRYSDTLGILTRDQAERVFTKDELTSYLLFGDQLRRRQEIEQRVGEIRVRMCRQLDVLFRQRRFSEFVVAYRCMQALLPPSLLSVTTADTDMGSGFVESFVRREGLIRLIPTYTVRLHQFALKYQAGGKPDAANVALEEARRLNEYLWHIPL